MLIETITRQTVSLQGFKIESVKQDSGTIVVNLAPDKRFRPRCGVCKSVGVYRDRRKTRSFRHVPIWGYPVVFTYSPRRVICSECDSIHVEHMPWAAGKRRQTAAFAYFLATWAKLLPWQEVARLFNCAWGTVASAVEFVVAYGLAHRDLSDVVLIGIDEISRKKGHHYLTNVYDLKSRKLIWSGQGRSKDTIREFFIYLGKDKSSNIQGVCCDMWQPYFEIVKQYAPQATLVFDKFHIVRHLTMAVDEVRRAEIREKGREHKDLMKNSRYIWLKNPWNLTDQQKARFSGLEKLNLKINRAYLLKESFRNFWSYKTKYWAEKYLKKWFWWATHSRLKPMRNFAWMIRRHEENILSYFILNISNGSVEGLNNKAKVVSRRAYGFRSAKNYILNLYHCLADLPMPKLVHSFL